jgi:putative ABC transport system substrate-binding protein
MRRRTFIAMTSGASVAWPWRAHAQPALSVVGYLSTSSADVSAPSLDFFRADLRESGYVVGRNVALEIRWADGDYARLPALAAELVALKVALIVAIGGPALRAALQATRQIPIVFQIGADPAVLGLVESLGRPGGNATGVNLHLAELTPQRLELLRELVPQARTVGLLYNPAAPAGNSQLADVQSAARGLGLTLQILEAGSADGIERSFARLAERRPQALLVASDVLLSARRGQIVALAARHALPAIYEQSAFVVAGGLVSYGPDLRAAIRPLGVYSGRILGGARPADLPVQQPTRFELMINLKAAKALGLVVPPSLLDRADKVIE